VKVITAPAYLAPWVLGVSILRTAAPISFAVPAHALASLTVVLRGQLSPSDGVGALLSAGSMLGSGSSTQSRPFVGSASLICATLLCRASVLPQLTGESASVFCNAAVPPEVFGKVDMERLMLRDTSDHALALELFCVVDRRLRAARAPRSAALRFAQAMAAWSEICHVRTATALPDGWSERQWQRACQAELGVTPKLLARLSRLHASVRLRSRTDSAAWARHALDAGFYDQAHMGREYRLLAGVSPTQSLGGAMQHSRPSPLWLGATQLAPSFFSA
jgi:AraC-like DNA-binding protein